MVCIFARQLKPYLYLYLFVISLINAHISACGYYHSSSTFSPWRRRRTPKQWIVNGGSWGLNVPRASIFVVRRPNVRRRKRRRGRRRKRPRPRRHGKSWSNYPPSKKRREIDELKKMRRSDCGGKPSASKQSVNGGNPRRRQKRRRNNSSRAS